MIISYDLNLYDTNLKFRKNYKAFTLLNLNFNIMPINIIHRTDQ